MKNFSTNYAVLGALLVSLTGCPADDNETESATNTTPGTTTNTTPGTTTTMGMTTGTTDDMTTEPTGGPSTDPTTTTTMTTDPMTGTTGEPAGYNFPDNPYDDYTQIDRHAAVEAGTAAIAAPSGLGLNGEDIAVRDMYNASNPEEDAAMMWLPEIAKSITFFHDALDDDIMGFGLTPATFDQTVAQAGPVIIPDTIKYDPSMPTAYPNGRKLEDRVVDITLAAVLLDLGMHPLDTFASIPLNPPQNDLPFKAEFPFLADPH